MAIAYKSAGAGAATETSGAACSPASPAAVDAGDILIIHAYFEGTATAPSTPSGFTLLSGPHVVETSIGRHWVYGKIAAGTEDGAANALGTAAVTTMRSGRCYSFSGRVSGAITDLVTGFAATSHATDPQMPSVTTTAAGALAVALVLQHDNTALGAATGMSGGTWAEAVAEFVSALTPGLVLQLQTCTPTADPGTVSGGAVAATNDPSGVVGFQILAAPAAAVVNGTLAVTEEGDTAAGTAVTPIVASLAATEAGDTASSTAVSPIVATAAITEGGDTAAGTAVTPVVATLAATEAGDTITSTGGAPPVLAVLAATEAGDTITSTAVAPARATAGLTEAGDTAAGTAVSSVRATAALTEAGDSLTSTAALRALAALAATEAGDTASSTAVAPARAAAGLTEAGDSLTSTAVTPARAVLAATEEGDTASSTAGGTVPVLAVLAVTEEGDTAAGSVTSAVQIEITCGGARVVREDVRSGTMVVS